MKYHPMLFNTQMVRATLADRKDMTRRIIKPQPGTGGIFIPELFLKEKCKYKPGDRIWVRETWRTQTSMSGDFRGYYYKADDASNYKWNPSIYMPRVASRITLEIVDVRIERVQEISPADIKREGIDPDDSLIIAFSILWDSLNKKRGFPWDDDPWVWVISFKRIKQ